MLILPEFFNVNSTLHLQNVCQLWYHIAGTIPVVVGAPNIQDFAPSPGSVLHIKELHDVASVAKTMRDLAANPDAYNHTLR